MKNYDHKEIEKKWQAEWEKQALYKTGTDPTKPKYYVCDMFPYPSGAGLHVGHPKGYIATDIHARKRRMEGNNVLYPMGWDSFGLPAEGYAIKTGTPPLETTEKSIINFKNQISNLALSYDWDRELATHTPEFYRWTQWLFLKFYEKGLAYKKMAHVNWCPKDQTVLANEQVIDGKCERCDSVVEQKDLEQWFFKITQYADELVAGLDGVDWPESTKINQRNWIGRSVGAEIYFELYFEDEKLNENRDSEGNKARIPVFTTRPDTLFGATYMVLAPEHQWVTLATDDNHSVLTNKEEVKTYVVEAKNKADIERTAEGKEKTGVRVGGVWAINPATHEKIPVYVADYVLGHYGTGAVMAVPSHDERDAEFAKKYSLPIKEIELANSEEIIKQFGTKVTKYKLRDWLLSRQRYWGAPIPIVYDPEGRPHPIPEEHLPWLLPIDVEYLPKGTSPLGSSKELLERTEKIFGKGWKPEIDTMDTFVDSSWYFMRYADPHNTNAFASKEMMQKWLPIDLYVGGAEHTVLHLMYARFFTKALRDMGYLSLDEPFMKLRHVGLVLAEDGRKMSKRWGNVINPDDVVNTFGADSMRTYEMFMGPFEQQVAWSTNGVVGVRRFIERVHRLSSKVGGDSPELDVVTNQTVKKVTHDIDAFKFNTAVSQMMIWSNEADTLKQISQSHYETFLKLLAPFAPHITEELWEGMGHTTSIHKEAWPDYDTSKLLASEVTIAIQVGGKLKGTVTVPQGASEAEVLAAARSDQKMAQNIPQSPKRVIFIADRVLNLIP